MRYQAPPLGCSKTRGDRKPQLGDVAASPRNLLPVRFAFAHGEAATPQGRERPEAFLGNGLGSDWLKCFNSVCADFALTPLSKICVAIFEFTEMRLERGHLPSYPEFFSAAERQVAPTNWQRIDANFLSGPFRYIPRNWSEFLFAPDMIQRTPTAQILHTLPSQLLLLTGKEFTTGGLIRWIVLRVYPGGTDC
jgi:hypothetical protein